MFLGSAIGAVFLYRDVKRGHMLEADAKRNEAEQDIVFN